MYWSYLCKMRCHKRCYLNKNSDLISFFLYKRNDSELWLGYSTRAFIGRLA